MPTKETEGGGGGMNMQSTEDLQGSENTLHDIKMMDTCNYLFVQIYRKYTTKNKPHVNYELCVIMMGPCR